MRPTIARLGERIDAMSLRERLLVFLAVGALVVTLFDTVLLEPRFASAKRVSLEIARQQGELATLEKQIKSLLQAAQEDPDREKRARLDGLQRQLAQLEASIVSEQAQVTTPQQMRSVVEKLIARNPSVTLVELRTMPKGEAQTQKPAMVHRHGLEVTVAGGYLDLISYLSDLERLPQRVYWAALALDATAHPRIVLKLSVYTLSLDAAWMSV